ncbi:MAG TPA: hypothetical protein PK620_13060 [Denitromonas sp.]|nr:hypothetical protein [Denitromonas sp.]HQV15841.1 hypothetical protein [Denitromonas sp.]
MTAHLQKEVGDALATSAKGLTIPAAGWGLYAVTLQDVVLVLTAASVLANLIYTWIKIYKALKHKGDGDDS